MPANLRCTFYCFFVLLFDYVMHLRSWCSRRTTNTSMTMTMIGRNRVESNAVACDKMDFRTDHTYLYTVKMLNV